MMIRRLVRSPRLVTLVYRQIILAPHCSLRGHCDCHDVSLDDAVEFGKILLKHLNELARGDVECLLVAPCFPRLQDAAVDALDCCGHLEAEIFIQVEFAIVERAIERGRQEGTCHIDGHPPSDTILPAGPTGVHQPAIYFMLLDKRSQQVAIDRRMTGHERRTEASRKGRLWLDHALLRSGNLGGITR